MHTYNGLTYFDASDGVHGSELWRSDGTPEGTFLVKDIMPGNGSSQVKDFVEMGGMLYFSALDSEGRRNIWRTDGSAIGTVKVTSFKTASVYSSRVTSTGNRIYFLVLEQDNPDFQLWATDGNPGSEQMVTIANGIKWDLASLENTLYYIYTKDYSSYKIWKVEADGNGVLLEPTELAPPAGEPKDILTLNGKLYFRVTKSYSEEELWETDGTVENTKLIASARSGSGRAAIGKLFSFNNKIYFVLAQDNTQALWASDGTASGTAQVISPTTQQFDLNAWFVAHQGYLYFSVYNGGPQIWRTDGISTAPEQVNIEGANYFNSYPEQLTSAGNNLYFTAGLHPYGKELWLLEGTAPLVKLVKDILPGIDDSSPNDLHAFGNKILFSAADGVHGKELWISEGTASSTKMVKDINPSTQGSEPGQFIRHNNLIYFVANNGIAGNALWQSNGSSAGTSQIVKPQVYNIPADNIKGLSV
ncbi:hypothetical protein GCM10027293_38660 [Pontibacter aydingkolensis]